MVVTFARYIKDLGALSPEELTSLFSGSRYTEEEKEGFLAIMKTLVYDGKQLNIPKHSAGGKAKSLARASKGDISHITRRVLVKMRQNLAEYEANDQLDQLQICFAIGVNYGQMAMEAIRKYHKE